MKHSAFRLRAQQTRSSRDGVAMVLSLILIVVLSATAAAALSMVGSERRAVEDHEAAAEAHAPARSAYDRFIANPTGSLPSFSPTSFVGPDSAHYTFADGYAWVSVQRIRPSISGSAPLFLVRSRAVRTVDRPANTPVAERVFAQYAQWNDVEMPAIAAWTSLSGLLKNGGSGVISGTDNCGSSTPLAGVAVPDVPGYVQSGGASVPSGSPGILTMGSQTQANSLVEVDWSGIINGMSLSADVVFPGGVWPSFADPNDWPVIYVDQATSFALPGSGRGMLIVRNDMTISDAMQWDGIILVGGTFTSNGNNTVSGAIVTGLNTMLGQVVLPSNIGNGTKTYTFDSCNVENAVKKFNGLAPLRNSSADNWSSY
jgi:hypothetical protein